MITFLQLPSSQANSAAMVAVVSVGNMSNSSDLFNSTARMNEIYQNKRWVQRTVIKGDREWMPDKDVCLQFVICQLNLN